MYEMIFSFPTYKFFFRYLWSNLFFLKLLIIHRRLNLATESAYIYFLLGY